MLSYALSIAAAAENERSEDEPEQPEVNLYPEEIFDTTLHTLMESMSDSTRKVVIGRELTKKFETIEYLNIQEIGAWLETKPNLRGEFAILVGPNTKNTGEQAHGALNPLELIKALEPHLGSKQIAEILNQVTDISKKDAYQLALDNKKPAA